MIKKETKLIVADNSGAKVVQCIGFFKSIKCGVVGLNDIICVSIKNLNKKKFFGLKGKSKTIKKQKVNLSSENSKQIYKAIIISCRKKSSRSDGSFIKSQNNRVVLIAENWKFLGSKIFGPVLKETRKKKRIPFFKELISFAKCRI